jgi:predicted pyridoxine 5'-phosphate oxidase superfamily flavin-nucleotide-binding protein
LYPADPRRDRNDDADTSVAGMGDYLIQLIRKIRKIEVAVAVHQHLGLLSAKRIARRGAAKAVQAALPRVNAPLPKPPELSAMESILYHEGSRRLQDAFESRRIADRLEEKLARTRFTDEDIAFVESRPFFFLATADSDGRPDCSFKGGMPGFVRVVGPSELAFPDYDGNGMFKSLGNVMTNPAVGILFIDFERPRRLRLTGQAKLSRDDALLPTFAGAQMLVRVEAKAIFPNCPRYIPKMSVVETSPYIPVPAAPPVEPAWKSSPDFRDCIHPRQPTA